MYKKTPYITIERLNISLNKRYFSSSSKQPV